MLRKVLRCLSLSSLLAGIWLMVTTTVTDTEGGETGIWESLGPRGGMALTLAASPSFADDSLVLAGEYQTLWYPTSQSGVGVRRSVDGGLTWQPTSVAPPDAALSVTLALHDLAFSPAFAVDQTVFAATWDGLFRSTDGGESWQAVDGAPDQFITSVAVAPDFATSEHVMAGYGYAMAPLLYVSEDGGQSWDVHNDVPAWADIAYSPQFATDGMAFTAGDGVYLTTNRGISWTQVLTSAAFALAVSPQFATDATLFAAGTDAVYVSITAGAEWTGTTVATDTTRIEALAISPAFGADGILFAGSPGGLYRSTDRGQHWSPVVPYPGPDAYAIALAPTWPITPTLLVGSTAGVYRSDDGGSTWTQGQGLALLDVSRLVQGPDPALLTAATTHHGVYQSRDGGMTWRFAGLRLSGQEIDNVALSPTYGSDGTMLATVTAGAGMGWYRTTSSGDNWESIGSTDWPGGGLAFSPAFPTDPEVFSTGQHGKVLSSTNLGDIWVPVGAPPTGTLSLEAWHVALPPTYPTDGTRFAGGAGFWRLPPGAETWELSATGLLTEAQVTSLAVSPDYAVDHALVLTEQRTEPDWSTSSGVYRSVDGGLTWDRLTNGLPPIDTTLPPQRVAFSPDYATDRTLYAQTEALLYRSTDSGDHWTAISVPSETTPLEDVAGGTQGRAYVGGKTGVWRYTALTRSLYLPLVLR